MVNAHTCLNLLILVWVMGAAVLAGYFHPLLWEDTKAFLSQPRDKISLVFHRSTLGFPPRWACLKYLPRDTSGEAS